MSLFIREDRGDSMRKFGTSTKKKKVRIKGSYQRYFDGYVEVRVPKEKGKGEKTVRLYVDDYHLAAVSSGMKLALRLFYLSLLTGAVVLFALAGWQDTAFNNNKLVACCLAAALAMMAWCAFALVLRYIPRWGKMTNWQYRSGSVNLCKSALYGCYWLGGCALVTALSYFGGEDALRDCLLSAAGHLGAAVLLFFIRFTESKVPYRRMPSGVKAPVGAVDIASMTEIRPPKKEESTAAGSAKNR